MRRAVVHVDARFISAVGGLCTNMVTSADRCEEQRAHKLYSTSGTPDLLFKWVPIKRDEIFA